LPSDLEDSSWKNSRSESGDTAEMAVGLEMELAGVGKEGKEGKEGVEL